MGIMSGKVGANATPAVLRGCLGTCPELCAVNLRVFEHWLDGWSYRRVQVGRQTIGKRKCLRSKKDFSAGKYAGTGGNRG